MVAVFWKAEIMFDRRLNYLTKGQKMRHIRFGIVEVVDIDRQYVTLKMSSGDNFQVSWDSALSVLQTVHKEETGQNSFSQKSVDIKPKNDSEQTGFKHYPATVKIQNSHKTPWESPRSKDFSLDEPPSMPTHHYKEQSRPYQIEALKALTESLKDHDDVLLALPTGSGKTYVAAKWLVDHVISRNGRIVWVAHRIELLEQAYLTFARLLPPHMATEISWWAGSRPKNPNGRILLVSVAATRMLPELETDFLVIDEAHHEPAPTYQRLKELLNYRKHIGLTATPERLDDKALGYTAIAYQRSFFSLVEEGWLARPKAILPKTGMRFQLQQRMDDFADESLAELNSPSRNKLIVEHWQSNAREYGNTLVFAINRDHAKTLTALFKKLCPNVKTEFIISGENSQAERDTIVQEFRNGKIDILVNCKIFTEGLDVPDIKTIFLTRPTLSPTLYLQMVGRGTRKTHSKSHFFLVDFQDDLGKFQDKLIGSWILNGKESEQPEFTVESAEKDDREKIKELPEWVKDSFEEDNLAINDLAGYVEYQPLGTKLTGFIVHASDEAVFLKTWKIVPDPQTENMHDMPRPQNIIGQVICSKMDRIDCNDMIAACLAKMDGRGKYVSLQENVFPLQIREFLSDLAVSKEDRELIVSKLSEIVAIIKYAPDEIDPELEFCVIYNADEKLFKRVMEELERATDLKGLGRRQAIEKAYNSHMSDTSLTCYEWERFAIRWIRDPESALLYCG